MKSDEELHRYFIRLPLSLYEKLREESYRTRRPISEIVRECIERHYGVSAPPSDPASE